MQKKARRVVIAPRPSNLEYHLIVYMNLSKERLFKMVCKDKGATEANEGNIHLMSRAEGPESKPVPVAAVILLWM